MGSANLFSELHSFELNFADRLIRPPRRFSERRGVGGHAQHAPAGVLYPPGGVKLVPAWNTRVCSGPTTRSICAPRLLHPTLWESRGLSYVRIQLLGSTIGRQSVGKSLSGMCKSS